MSAIIIAGIAVVALAAVIYFDRKSLKAKVVAAEGALLSEALKVDALLFEALKVDAALRAKEANVKSALRRELENAVASAKAELETAGVDAKAVLANVATRLRSLL